MPADDPTVTDVFPSAGKPGGVRIAAWVVLSLLLLGAAVGIGRHVGHEVPRMEVWVEGLGLLGPVAFVLLFVVMASVFVPDSLFAVLAGVAFGLAWGTTVLFAAGVITAVLNFFVARRLLRRPIENMLGRHPKLLTVDRAARRDGLRVLFLLRLAPINPSLVSYVLGTTGVRFHAFLAACLGLLPAYFVAVYLGYAAKHATKLAGNVSEHSTAHHIATFSGLALSIVLLLGLAHYARKAIQEATAPSFAPQSG